MDVDARVNSVGRPVELRLDEGAYSVVPIGIGQGGQFEGWSSWSETTCSAIAGCPRTFPTTAKGFLGDYRVRSAAIGSVFVDGLELEAVREDDGLASTFVRLDDDDRDDDDRDDDDRDDDDRDDDDRDDDEREDQAYIRVSNMMVYPDDILARANAPVTIFTLDRPATVGFAITDSLGIADNRGGISFRLTRMFDTSPSGARGRPAPGAAIMPVDFEPRRCPNRLETGRRGKKHVTVAILGTDRFDGTEIDPTSVRVAGVSPERWKVKDVAGRGDFFDGVGVTDCRQNRRRDGRRDLELRFNREVLGDALGNLPAGEAATLTLTGKMKQEAGGDPFSGRDVVIISR